MASRPTLNARTQLSQKLAQILAGLWEGPEAQGRYKWKLLYLPH